MSNEMSEEQLNRLYEYRKDLRNIQTNLYVHYDKTLVALSGGTLGILLYRLDYLLTLSKIPTYWLFILPLCFALCLVAVLLGIFFGRMANGKAIKEIDDAIIRGDPESLDNQELGGLYSYIFRLAHNLSLFAFCIGLMLVFIMLFIYY